MRRQTSVRLAHSLTAQGSGKEGVPECNVRKRAELIFYLTADQRMNILRNLHGIVRRKENGGMIPVPE